MDSKTAEDQKSFVNQLNSNLENLWSNLSDSQKAIFKKLWSILTYKWQWQVILNAPFLVIWIFDQTIPAVHSFDMKLISSLQLPTSLQTLLGFG
tara:strand:+ start:344 stop:625 length:282 start_codon:yes stop_codon:yes gene_type:complete